MTGTPREEPGFEVGMDDLPEDDRTCPATLEQDPLPEDASPGLDEAHENVARHPAR